METTEKQGLGILMAVLACFLLSVMNAAVKFLTLQGYPTLEIIFFTGLIGLACVMGWLLWKGHLAQIKTSDPWMVLYTCASVGAGFSLFYAFGTGRLAEMGTIVAAAPLMIAALSFVFLHERLRRMQLGLILLGFLGILLVLKPRPELGDYLVFCIAVLGTFLFAASQVIVRKLRHSIPTLAFTFYFYLGFCVIAGMTMPYRPVAAAEAPFFLLTGLCDVISLVLLYSGFKLASASLLAPYQYSQILWNAVFGYIIWHERPDIWTFMGAAIIIGAGILFMRSSLHAAR